MQSAVGSRRARWVVLAVLVSNAVWVVVVPWALTSPPTALLATLWLAGLVGAAVSMSLVMYVAATGDARSRHRIASTVAVVVAACLLWGPAFAWADPGQAPWAWLAGFLAGAVALAWRWLVAVAVTIGFTLAAAVGAIAYGTAILPQVVTLWAAAAVIVAMLHVLVWMLRLLEQAERARDTEAELALAEERLRMGRELHDVLGHRLAIIAVKAELVDGLSDTDPGQVRTEAEEIRRLTTETLAEVRRALHGETVTGFHDQLQSARLVLDSAGIELVTALDEVPMSAEESRLLAAVLREAITNALRYGPANRLAVSLVGSPAVRRLDILTDGRPAGGAEEVRSGHVGGGRPGAATRPGTGLAGLADRCERMGAALTWGPRGEGGFAVRVTLPDSGPDPQV